MIFLVEYDRVAGKTMLIRPYSDAERNEVEEVRLKRELELNRAQLSREVVLLEALSETALRKTHRRYFEDVDTLAISASASTTLATSEHDQ